MNRAYSLITVKEFDEVTGRRFSGIATTPTPDRVDDVMEPLGMEFSNPMPMHLFHHSDEPVGTVAFGRPTSKGIPFTATIPEIAEPGEVKTLTDKAAHFVKYGLIRAVSIGFRPLGDAIERMKSGGIRYLKTEILEISLVSIPANQEATITLVKSLDTEPAALGTGSAVASSKPSGATDTRRVMKARTDRSMKKSIADQIVSFKSERDATYTKKSELVENGDEGLTLDESQKVEYKELVAKISSLDEHIEMLEEHQQSQLKAAKPIHGDTQEKASMSRANTVIQVKNQTPPGIEFARYAMCLASAKGNTHQALEIAHVRYPDESRIHTIIKAAVESGTTIDATWAGSLVQYQDFAGDFIEFLRPQTIIGKFGANGVPALQRVPFNIRVARQTTGGSGYWVGEGKPKPLTKFGFDTVTMRWAKVANIAVLTEEEVRWSTPSAEAKVRDALAGALIERLDIDFVDPAKAAVSNVSPASITNGVVATAPTGVTAAFFRADVRSLMAPMIAADISLSSLVWIMSATQALALSLIQNALGQQEFPTLTLNGGTLMGIPVIVSEHMTAVGSPSTQMILLVSASDIYLADDGQVVIDASREASLEMLDSSLQQDSTAGTGASLVSMWQSNCLALKAERFINWSKRRTEAAQYISPAAYVG